MKLLAGTAEISYDNFGRPSTGLFDHTNVSNKPVYLNASRVGGLGKMLYDDMWVEISHSSDTMTNNYSLKPVPKNSSRQGEVLEFSFYNNENNEENLIQDGEYKENGRRVRVKYHVIANSDTNLSLSFRGQTIGETKINKTEGTEYTIIDGPIVVLSEELNKFKVKNENGGNITIAELEFVPVDEDEVKELNPIKKDLDFKEKLEIKDSVDNSLAYYSSQQNIAYLGNEIQYVTFKVNVPEEGEYTLNLEDSINSKNKNLLSNFEVVNLSNHKKFNEGEQIKLVKGENRLQVVLKPIKNVCVEDFTISENGNIQDKSKYEAELLKNQSENITVESEKVVFNSLNSFVDLKLNNTSGTYKDITIDIQGQGEVVLTNQISGATVYGASHINNVIDRLYGTIKTEPASRAMKLVPGINIIRVAPQNNGHLLTSMDVERKYKEIIGYN